MASTSLGGGAIPSEDELMPPVDKDTMERMHIADLTMYKILTFLPPSSVTRSKVVCKSWFSHISCHLFARDHAAASPASSPSILRFNGAARFPATIIDENGTEQLALHRWQAGPREGYSMQNCCGSIACLRNGQGGAELLNPATGHCLDLGGDCSCDDDTRKGFPWYCLGRCGSTGEYKVVRLQICLPYSSPPNVTCQMCAIGGRGGYQRFWQEVGLWGLNYFPSDRGVHVDGVVYYLAGFYGYSVVGFDLSSHARRHIDLPVDGAVVTLSELEGQLCASLVPRGGKGEGGKNMDLWLRVLGAGAQHRWIHRYRFELDGAGQHVPRPLFVTGRRMLIMQCADGSLCSHDVQANSSIDGDVLVFAHKSRPRMTRRITADVFVESLLPLSTILQS